MKRIRTSLIVAVAALAGAAALSAQPVMTQDGHALDANPGVGSRINGPGGANVNPGLNGRYLMTNEARLGRSFHGFVPYSATDQFQTNNLGSASLYNFQLNSTSLPLIMRSGGDPAIIQSMPYQGSTRTVFSAGQTTEIVGPTATPGVLNPFARPQYQPPPPPPTRASTSAIPDYNLPLFSSVRVPELTLADQINYRRELLARTTGLPLGEVDLVTGLPLLPRLPLPETVGLPKITPIEMLESMTLELGAMKLRPVKPISPADAASKGEVKPGAAPEGQPERKPGEGAAGAAQGVVNKSRAALGQENLPPGQDLYSDLLLRAQVIQQRGEAPAMPGPVAVAAPGAPGGTVAPAEKESAAGLSVPTGPIGSPDIARRLGTGLPSLKEQEAALTEKYNREHPNATLAPLPKTPVIPGQGNTLPAGPAGSPAGRPGSSSQGGLVNLNVRHSSLASQMPTLPNRLIRESEQLMGLRRYYDALKDLALAAMLDPQNPLIWLRGSHAYFGAGEFLTSAGDLQRAMQLFPSVITVRTDLPGLSDSPAGVAGSGRAVSIGPGAKVLADRLVELGQLAQRTDNPDLWMLLCYVQYVSGQSGGQPGSPAALDLAGQSAQSAQHLLKSESASAEAWALAHFVLESKPSGAATTAPAE